jgi:hypothetical protein
MGGKRARKMTAHTAATFGNDKNEFISGKKEMIARRGAKEKGKNDKLCLCHSSIFFSHHVSATTRWCVGRELLLCLISYKIDEIVTQIRDERHLLRRLIFLGSLLSYALARAVSSSSLISLSPTNNQNID